MLERIERIQGIGLFHNAGAGARHRLGKVTLVYAGNGRGKSTLASVLASCASGDASLILDRVTIDGSIDASVFLQFDSGTGVNFQDKHWSETRSEIAVYDDHFVSSNVHSGTEVTSEQRKNLLDFALGTSAVSAREQEEVAVLTSRAASSAITDLKKQIQEYAGSAKVPVFKAIAPVDNAATRLQELQERLSAADRSAEVQRLLVPTGWAVPSLDLARVFGVLNRTLQDVHAAAEKAVDAHVRSIDRAGVSDWLRHGQQFDNHEACPYCGQSTHGVELVRMYQTHFNQEFQDLRSSTDATARLVAEKTSESIVDEFAAHRARMNERIELWRHHIDLVLLTDERDGLARATLKNLRELLGRLLSAKASAPTDRVGLSGDQEEAERLWKQFCQVVLDENDVLESYSARIGEYRSLLQSENVDSLRSEVARIQLSQVRHSDEVKLLFVELDRAETALRDAEEGKNDARKTLTSLMEATLRQYRDAINNHLRSFGAAFAVGELKHNYFGGAPRTEYQIELRGVPVELTGGRPSFATALSEGDKRTMAFAFFVASTLADPELARKIIVIDDPMSSLDASRRRYTSDLLVKISNSCSQLIVLAHDATFLRDLRISLAKQGASRQVASLSVVRVADDYSDFGLVDLDRECESVYYSHYRTISGYVAGEHQSHRETAVALRPLLEGYLHRRFPGTVSDGVTLGVALQQIAQATAPSPLVHAQPLLSEMRSLNDFALGFHHDTNPDYAQMRVDPAEVNTYGRRVLSLVHGAPVGAS